MRSIPVLFALFMASIAWGQHMKTPVYLHHRGEDQIGSRLVSALKAELEQSTKYEPAPADLPREGTKLFLEIVTVDGSCKGQEPGRRSAVSVVIEYMIHGESQIPAMWYHKIMLVEREGVDDAARTLLTDMGAKWCRTVKSSGNSCPKELLP